jgi:hypothetical protein
MSGLLKLLTFPVSGPILGTRFIMDTVVEEAERQYYDQQTILQQLNDLEQQYREGQVTEAVMQQEEEALLKRLMEARAYHEQKRQEE